MTDSTMESMLDPSKLEMDSPDWDKASNSHELTLVHMQEKEVESLLALQKKPIFSEIEGLGKVYSFPDLAEMFDNPAIRRLFVDSVHHKRSTDPQKDNLLNDLHAEGLAHLPDISSDVPGGTEGQEELAAQGEGDDNMVVEVPLNVVKMFVEIEGREPNINPNTGLLAFGGIFGKRKGASNDIIRGLATLAGAMYGGGTGAAIGHSLGRMATGQEFTKTLIPSAKVGLLTYGAQKLLPHIPGVQSGIDKLSQYSPSIGKGAAALAGTSASLNMPGVSDIANMGNNAVSGATKGITSLLSPDNANAGTESKGTGKDEGGILSNVLKSELLPLGLVHGLNYMGSQRHQKFLEKQQRESEERYEKERARHHFDQPWVEPTFNKKKRNPAWTERGTEPYYITEGKEFARGGMVTKSIKPQSFVEKKVDFAINGPGKGQDDLIVTKLEPGGFILPADVTAMVGDGATDAGHATIKEFVNRFAPVLRKKIGGGVPKPKGFVDARVANGETALRERFVTGLGDGSNDRGAKMLDNMMKRLRAHKNSNGDGLPPKAHDLSVYIFGEGN